MAKLTLELNEIVNGVTINESPIQLTSEGLLASAATIASDVTFTPTGGISATNVQAALAEVDSEKLSLSGGTMTGNVQFTDTQRIQLGTGFDFQMYHDGSNSYLRDFGVGDLILQASKDRNCFFWCCCNRNSNLRYCQYWIKYACSNFGRRCRSRTTLCLYKIRCSWHGYSYRT